MIFGQDKSGVPCHEYFFGLKNVTFCGFHPRDHRYFAFITKVAEIDNDNHCPCPVLIIKKILTKRLLDRQ